MNKIEQFIEEKIKPEFRPIFLNFRTLVQNKFPFIQEEMRGGTEKYYGVPVYRNNKIIVTVSPTQKGITFSFTEGKKMKDKFGKLEGVGNKSLNLRITSLKNYSDAMLEYYIMQAIEIDSVEVKNKVAEGKKI
ncbi:DUF1801 domain-containing protein [Sphingobacterium sp. SYP-B4668]|uniref:DUF1801 domain-containing protein n=1 Tax=Sphingobacterium sp. SYP-B4668 TaxID=2996035 RepID=UPI0022DD866D|nr:DUF1801 domain-containing protein [Sphingobacterium sp. SYP-B4668]